MTIKLTKNEFRLQQLRLNQFERYLPTLQLKKSMLQVEVTLVDLEISRLEKELSLEKNQIEPFASFLLDKVPIDLERFIDVLHVRKHYENIAGVEIPIFDRVVFRDADYPLFSTPAWSEGAIEILRHFVSIREKMNVAEEKKKALEKELKEVSIRVNLFEKVLIPRSQENIKKIRIFLGDQQLASVAQAKVAKKKIELRKEQR